MLRRAGFALLAIVAAAQAAPAIAQNSNLKVITRGTVSATAADWPDFVARAKGFYEKEGLKVEHAVISPTTITPSLIGGSVQIGFINASQMIIADKAGADLVAIGKGADPSPYSLMAQPSIKKLTDLKGKTISLAEQGDAYAEATREILRKAGLDPEKDLTIRYGGNSNQRFAALQAGAVDAVPVVPPQDRILIAKGYNVIAFYPDYFPNLALSVTAVKKSWAEANGDTVKAFMRAQANAVAWMYEPANREESVKILMQNTKADLDSANQAYDIYITKMHMYSKCVETKGLVTLIDFLSRINKSVKADDDVKQFIETKWCAG